VLDSRRIALLGILSAVNAGVRLMGTGFAGVETAFALIILSAYVFGSRFGFLLGTLSILVSSLMDGGVGPWLPFQLVGAALVGFGAGLIPKPKRIHSRLISLSIYGVISSYFYGAFLTFWTWPLFSGSGTSISFLEGGSLSENGWRFLQFEFYSGGLLWDTGRAITTIALILLTGKALMATLERAANRANYANA
jgi:energy-coupling factor transport system substrate-specific component